MWHRVTLPMLGLVVAFGFGLAGCGSAPPPKEKPAAGAHDHPEEGPHHGHLIELGGGEYHAELTHDDATKTVAIYLLGKDAKKQQDPSGKEGEPDYLPAVVSQASFAPNLSRLSKPKTASPGSSVLTSEPTDSTTPTARGP